MSTPGNAAKLRTALSNILTAQSCPSLVKIEPTIINALISILLSQRISSPCQTDIFCSKFWLSHTTNQTILKRFENEFNFSVFLFKTEVSS